MKSFLFVNNPGLHYYFTQSILTCIFISPSVFYPFRNINGGRVDTGRIHLLIILKEPNSNDCNDMNSSELDIQIISDKIVRTRIEPICAKNLCVAAYLICITSIIYIHKPRPENVSLPMTCAVVKVNFIIKI